MTTHVHVEIDDELSGRIRRLAELRRESPDRILREAIAQYADRADARQSFLEEADASWEAFQKDGLHLTGEEVRAWLRTWDSEDKSTLPECHK